ncbi:DUF2066 domain-containing protein [Alteromonas sp. H39]|uniref:DUF2066 domain-containing protein n=1 Tax=Alteromonas sp. H39 TaxID=3389876 RepID=UPI0039E15533
MYVAVFVSLPATATVQIDTHVGQVQVENQNQSTQQQASREALKQVLIKMSGTTTAPENAGVKTAVRSPGQYLRSYRFDDIDGQLYYIAEFDQQALLTLLRREGLPVWGNRRPETILWLAVENDNGQRDIVEEAQSDVISQAVRETARSRGIRVSLPLMDLTDNQAIAIYDIWGRFPQALIKASSRYGVDYIIGARLYKNNNAAIPNLPEPDQETLLSEALSENWNHQDNAVQSRSETRVGVQQVDTLSMGAAANVQYQVANSQPQTVADNVMPFSTAEFEAMMAEQGEGEYALDWVFIRGNDVKTGSLYGNDKSRLAQLLINGYASYLADIFSIKPGQNAQSSEKVKMSVANLDSLENYVMAQRYLASLSVVEHVSLSAQSGSVGTFELSLLGSAQDLINTMSLENRLQPVRDAFGQPVQGYNFYWNE